MEGKENNGSGLFGFINRIDLFVSVLWTLWALDQVFLSIFVDYDQLRFELPFFVVIIGAVATAVGAILIKRYWEKGPKDFKHKAVLLGWNALIPIVYNLIFMLVIETGLVYSYAGVFFGELGQWIFRAFNIILAIVYIIVFVIVNHVSKKRRKNGKEFSRESFEGFLHILNALIFVVGVVVGLWAAVTAYSGWAEAERLERDYQNTSAFREEMLGKIPDYADPADEADISILTVEMMYEGEKFDMDAENGNAFRYTTVSQEVFDEALLHYREFLEEYQVMQPFSGEEGAVSVLYCYDDRSIQYAFPTVCRNQDGESVICNAVCKYDEDWNLVKIYFKDVDVVTYDNHE